jgi:hypothetical protein
LHPQEVGSSVGAVEHALASNKPLVPGVSSPDSDNKEKAAPVYGHALTWKSDTVRAKDEYNRVKRHVRTVAPEQFVDRAKPSMEPANIFPRDVKEWQAFKSDSVVDRMSDLAKDMKKMGEMVKATENMAKDGVPQAKRVPKAYFGPKGKVFDDGLGPVLAQPSIWSEEYMKSDVPKAAWPSRAEMLEDGDSRENGQVRVRTGRHLPLPRFPQDPNEPYVSFKDRPAIPQYPLDQVGPIYRDSNGVAQEPTPAEIDAANEEMNNDPMFEAMALPLLGSDLMDEIGRWKKPVVPTWQERQRQAQAVGSGHPAAQQGADSVQSIGPASLEAQRQDSGNVVTPDRGCTGTASSQPMSSAKSYSGYPSNNSSDQYQQSNSTGYRQPAASVQSFGSSQSSMIDMTGWVLIGRNVIAGSNIGENFWLTPWGETVVYRDVW